MNDPKSTRLILLLGLALLGGIAATPVVAFACGRLENQAPVAQSPQSAAPMEPRPELRRAAEQSRGGAVVPTQPVPAPTVSLAGDSDHASLSESETFGIESPLYVAVRWVTFTAIVIAVGAVAFHALVLRILRRAYRRAQEPDSPMIGPASTRSASLGLWTALALGVAGLLRLYAQSYAFYGAEDALDAGLITTLLRHTVWGWGWLLQAAAVVIAAVGFAMARRGRTGWWGIATLGVVALAFTPALSGHAAAVPRHTWLAVLADGMHVIGAGGWLGSLLLVVAVGVPAALRLPDGERGQGAAELINAFSPTALLFAGIVVATGVFSAWLHLNSVSALWESSYGQTLLLKLAVLSVVAGTGAYNWLRVKPMLGSIEGVGRIRRSATLELAVGALVLIVTAVLVATQTPMDTMALQ